MIRIAVLTLAALVSLPGGDDAKRLDEAVRTLQRERKEYYRRLDDREQEIQEERRKGAILERERREREERRKALEAELEVARRENARAAADLDAANALDARLSKTATASSSALVSLLKEGLPYDLDRRLSRAGSEEGSSLDRLEALRSALREEIEEAREGALRTEDVTLPDGRRKAARVGRLGHALLFFVTEDGREGGVMVREAGSWRWSPADADGLQALKKAVRILARQDAPGRATLPFASGKDGR